MASKSKALYSKVDLCLFCAGKEPMAAMMECQFPCGYASKSAFQCCREKGEELRAAVEEWQTKRAVPEPRLTTGFLDGIQPIVDSYELKVQSMNSAFVTYIAFKT